MQNRQIMTMMMIAILMATGPSVVVADEVQCLDSDYSVKTDTTLTIEANVPMAHDTKQTPRRRPAASEWQNKVKRANIARSWLIENGLMAAPLSRSQSALRFVGLASMVALAAVFPVMGLVGAIAVTGDDEAVPAVKRLSKADWIAAKEQQAEDQMLDIIGPLFDGELPQWTKPWEFGGTKVVRPLNANTGREYRGANVWNLSGCTIPIFATKKQWYKVAKRIKFDFSKATGEDVFRPIETCNPRLIWTPFKQPIYVDDGDKKDAQGNPKKKRIWVVKKGEGGMTIGGLAEVYNIADTNLPIEAVAETIDFALSQPDFGEVAGAEDLDALVRKNLNGVKLAHADLDRACYASWRDEITMPFAALFKDNGVTQLESYTATLMHEAAHASGHRLRLARPLQNTFGDTAYAREELVAEMASVMAMRLLGMEINAPHHGKYLGGWANRVLGQPSGATDKAAWMDECRKVLAEATKASEWVLFGNPEWFEGAKTTEGADIEQGDNTVLNRAHAPTERIYFIQEREVIGHTYAVKAENWGQALEKFDDGDYEFGEALSGSWECLEGLSPKKVGMAVVRPCIYALKEQVISEDTGLLITRPKVKLVRRRNVEDNWRKYQRRVCYNEICMSEEVAEKNWGPDQWGYQESYVDESGVCRECREKEAVGFKLIPYNVDEDDDLDAQLSGFSFSAVGVIGLLPALLDPTMATLALTALVGAVMLSKVGGDDDAHWEKLHDEHPERFDENGIYHPDGIDDEGGAAAPSTIMEWDIHPTCVKGFDRLAKRIQRAFTKRDIEFVYEIGDARQKRSGAPWLVPVKVTHGPLSDSGWTALATIEPFDPSEVGTTEALLRVIPIGVAAGDVMEDEPTDRDAPDWWLDMSKEERDAYHQTEKAEHRQEVALDTMRKRLWMPNTKRMVYDPTICDHCGVRSHNRKKLVIVEHEHGRCRIVGSSCLFDYTNIDPKTLEYLFTIHESISPYEGLETDPWSWTQSIEKREMSVFFDIIGQMFAAQGNYEKGMGSRAMSLVMGYELLGWHEDESKGHGYVYASIDRHGAEIEADAVYGWKARVPSKMGSVPIPAGWEIAVPHDEGYQQDLGTGARAYIHQSMKEAREAERPDSFQQTLAVTSRAGCVTYKTCNFVAGAASRYFKEIQKEARAEANRDDLKAFPTEEMNIKWEQGVLATVADKRSFEGNYGPSNVLTLIVDDQYRIKAFSNAKPVREARTGDVVEIVSFIPTKVDEWQGQESLTVRSLKIKAVEQEGFNAAMLAPALLLDPTLTTLALCGVVALVGAIRVKIHPDSKVVGNIWNDEFGEDHAGQTYPLNCQSSNMKIDERGWCHVHSSDSNCRKGVGAKFPPHLYCIIRPTEQEERVYEVARGAFITNEGVRAERSYRKGNVYPQPRAKGGSLPESATSDYQDLQFVEVMQEGRWYRERTVITEPEDVLVILKEEIARMRAEAHGVKEINEEWEWTPELESSDSCCESNAWRFTDDYQHRLDRASKWVNRYTSGMTQGHNESEMERFDNYVEHEVDTTDAGMVEIRNAEGQEESEVDFADTWRQLKELWYDATAESSIPLYYGGDCASCGGHPKTRHVFCLEADRDSMNLLKPSIGICERCLERGAALDVAEGQESIHHPAIISLGLLLDPTLTTLALCGIVALVGAVKSRVGSDYPNTHRVALEGTWWDCCLESEDVAGAALERTSEQYRVYLHGEYCGRIKRHYRGDSPSTTVLSDYPKYRRDGYYYYPHEDYGGAHSPVRCFVYENCNRLQREQEKEKSLYIAIPNQQESFEQGVRMLKEAGVWYYNTPETIAENDECDELLATLDYLLIYATQRGRREGQESVHHPAIIGLGLLLDPTLSTLLLCGLVGVVMTVGKAVSRSVYDSELLAFGVGVDSSCLLAMHLNRDATCEYLGIDRATLDKHLPLWDAAVFSDTGAEWDHTYANLAYAQEKCEEAGFELVVVRNEKRGPIDEWHKERGVVPFFNGGKHTCSKIWKQEPMHKWAAERYGKGAKCMWSVGIAANENGRLSKFNGLDKKAADDGQYSRFPLTDLDITRVAAQDILRHLDWLPEGDEVSLSACYHCPYNTEADLRMLREKYPDLWVKAVEMEEAFLAASTAKHQKWLDEGQPLVKFGKTKAGVQKFRAPAGMWRDDYANRPDSPQRLIQRTGPTGELMSMEEWGDYIDSNVLPVVEGQARLSEYTGCGGYPSESEEEGMWAIAPLAPLFLDPTLSLLALCVVGVVWWIGRESSDPPHFTHPSEESYSDAHPIPRSDWVAYTDEVIEVIEGMEPPLSERQQMKALVLSVWPGRDVPPRSDFGIGLLIAEIKRLRADVEDSRKKEMVLHQEYVALSNAMKEGLDHPHPKLLIYDLLAIIGHPDILNDPDSNTIHSDGVLLKDYESAEMCRECGVNPMTNRHYEMCPVCVREYTATYACRCSNSDPMKNTEKYPCGSCIREMNEEESFSAVAALPLLFLDPSGLGLGAFIGIAFAALISMQSKPVESQTVASGLREQHYALADYLSENEDKPTPSDEQMAFINDYCHALDEWVEDGSTGGPRMVCEAVAGSGKTFVLKIMLDCTRRIEASLVTRASAFNRHIAQTMKDVLKALMKEGFTGAGIIGGSNSVQAGGAAIVRGFYEKQGVTVKWQGPTTPIGDQRWRVLSKLAVTERMSQGIIQSVASSGLLEKTNHRPYYNRIVTDVTKTVKALTDAGYIPEFNNDNVDLSIRIDDMKELVGRIAGPMGLNEICLHWIGDEAWMMVDDALRHIVETAQNPAEITVEDDCLVPRLGGYTTDLAPLSICAREANKSIADFKVASGLFWPPREEEEKARNRMPAGSAALSLTRIEGLRGALEKYNGKLLVQFGNGRAANASMEGDDGEAIPTQQWLKANAPGHRNGARFGNYWADAEGLMTALKQEGDWIRIIDDHAPTVDLLARRFSSIKGGFSGPHGESRPPQNDTILLSFADQVFLPNYLDLYLEEKWDVVFIDELQDLSEAKAKLIWRCIDIDHSAIICVGDRKQSIYFWSGASTEAFDDAAEYIGATRYPMTISWRGSTHVAEAASAMCEEGLKISRTVQPNADYPDYSEHTAPSFDGWREGGRTVTIDHSQIADAVKHIRESEYPLSDTEKPIAVLSYLTGALGGVIIQLVKAGIPITTPAGDQGIVTTVCNLLNKPFYDRLTNKKQKNGVGFNRLGDYSEYAIMSRLERVGRMEFDQAVKRANGDHKLAEKDDYYNEVLSILEMTECLIELWYPFTGMAQWPDQNLTVAQFKNWCNNVLFAAKGDSVHLSTVHKFKGDEAGVVFLLRGVPVKNRRTGETEVRDPFLLEHLLNQSPGTAVEQMNVLYVAATRAQDQTIIVKSMEHASRTENEREQTVMAILDNSWGVESTTQPTEDADCPECGITMPICGCAQEATLRCGDCGDRVNPDDHATCPDCDALLCNHRVPERGAKGGRLSNAGDVVPNYTAEKITNKADTGRGIPSCGWFLSRSFEDMLENKSKDIVRPCFTCGGV